MHALLLVVMIPHRMDMPAHQSNPGQEPLTVHLVRPPASIPAPMAAVPPSPRPQSVPRKSPLTALSKPAPPSRPLQEPAVPLAPVPDSTVPMDMTTMIQAARERRRAAEEVAASANAEAQAGSQEPSPNDIAMANIRHSLQTQSGRRNGTSGVFQILDKGTRTGRFIFRGWTLGARNSSQQTFEVDAGLGGDVERALVRRMIELIRKHYTGDFNWESHRLGRVIVQSARIEDSTELEAFLMKEFFPDDDGMRR